MRKGGISIFIGVEFRKNRASSSRLKCRNFVEQHRCYFGDVRRRQRTVSVHHRRRQEFEVADLQLAAFFDENDLEIEIRIKILALL